LPDVDVPTLRRYPRGATIPEQYGVLLFDKETGGAEVWDLPKGSQIARPSPSGRYIVWQEPAQSSCDGCPAKAQQVSLLDTKNGRSTVLIVDGQPATGARVFADEQRLVVVGQQGIKVLVLPGLSTAVTYHEEADGKGLGVQFAYSADRKSVAITRFATTPTMSSAYIVTDDKVSTAVIAGLLQWSHHGHRLAIANEEKAEIIDTDTGIIVHLDHGGENPSWSPNDVYLAINVGTAPGSESASYLSAFDTRTGVETLRAYGALGCGGVSWLSSTVTSTLVGSNVNQVKAGVVVPSGEFVAATEVQTPTPTTTGAHLAFNQDGTVQLIDGGRVVATATVNSMWSIPWGQEAPGEATPIALNLGRGGQDSCLGGVPDVTVVLPPFTPSKIPTPTPTVSK
jgi:hypothetical protein